MRILITGGAGSIGSYLANYFYERGYTIRLLDKDLGKVDADNCPYELICGEINDRQIVKQAVQDVDAVFHLAWSFAADLTELVATDIEGMAILLAESADAGIKHFINTSSSIVYGVPMDVPIKEEQPHLTAQARKPFYAFAKTICEDMCQLYNDLQKLPATTIGLWWAFADEIGGKHLKQMIRNIRDNGYIDVPDASGGSFAHMEDIALCFERTLFNETAFGAVYNVASAYVSWEEVARMIADEIKPQAVINVVAQNEWQGSAFQLGEWRLDTTKAETELGFRSALGEELFKKQLQQAIADLCQKV